MTAFVVVNPRSANGRTGRDWPEIHKGLASLFPAMTVATSHARGETAQLVRQALRDGHLNVIAVGGDGTINEAVNGFFEHGAPVSPDAVFGFVMSGLAGDVGRSFGIAPGYAAGIARLRGAHIRRIDVGRVSCLSLTGAPLTRHFINVASFGLSGRIARRINGARFAGKFGSLAFGWHALLSLMGWHSVRLRLIADQYDEIAGITMVAVANGGWFGGGLKLAPQADPADGFFELVVMAGAARRHLLKYQQILRQGRPLSSPALRIVRTKRLTAAPILETDGPVAIETDGESAGLLPATFEILPNALNLRC
jgi:diacylglycerol kinase (ATP)